MAAEPAEQVQGPADRLHERATGNVTSYVSGRKGCLLPAICFRS